MRKLLFAVLSGAIALVAQPKISPEKEAAIKADLDRPDRRHEEAGAGHGG